jgi:membrane-bound lytic murein transglycosylase F
LLNKYQITLIKSFAVLIAAYFIFMSPVSSVTEWQKVQSKGVLTWVTRPSPLTYYSSLDGIIGLEYDILNNFCVNNDLELEVVIADSNKELFDKLQSREVDIAGANLSETENRTREYYPTIAYDDTYVVLISSFRTPKFDIGKGLKDYKGVIINSSTYKTVSKSLSENNNANIIELNDISLYELLIKVANGDVDYTLADFNAFKIFKSFVPKLRLGAQLSKKQNLVFYLDKDDSIAQQLNQFISKYKTENKVSDYKEYIVNSLPNSSPADTVNFLKNYNRRWSKIRNDVYRVAKEHGMDPILLGAMSYQESHWNAKAVSPTLVKGLMMLTKAVANEENIKDRLNPVESLIGGVNYFNKMKKKIPARIPEPDSTQMALASYNVGYGHLEKARVLTQRAGMNPDSWKDVKIFLPELNKMEGVKADGKTAVRYVENIYVYQNLLQWKEQNHVSLPEISKEQSKN